MILKLIYIFYWHYGIITDKVLQKKEMCFYSELLWILD